VAHFHGFNPPIEPANHSIETAKLKVPSDILLGIEDGILSALALLDLSAASDRVDHDFLHRRLDMTYRLNGKS